MIRWANIIWIACLLALLLSFFHSNLKPNKKLAFAETLALNTTTSSIPALQATTTPTPTLSTEATPPPQSTPTPDLQPLGPTSTFSFTLATIGYGETMLTSPYGTAQFSFRLPENWLIEADGILNLDVSYNYGQLSNTDDPAFFGELTVILNGDPVDAVFIDEKQFENRRVRLNLPASALNNTDRLARIDLIFNADILCNIPHQASLIIHPTSSISLTYSQIPLSLDISNYPRPFFQRAFEPDIVRFVLPATPSAVDLTNAAAIAAKLGNLTNDRVVISSTTDIELENAITSDTDTAEEEHLIIIGQPQDNQIIPLLNDLINLPVSLHERQLELISQGPLNVAPGSSFSYAFTITNTIDQDVNLSIINNPPIQTELLECTANCAENTDEGIITWNNVSLPAGEFINLELTLQAADQLTTGLTLENTITLVEAEGGPLNAQTLVSAVADVIEDNQTQQHHNQTGHFFMYNGQAVVENDGIIQEIISPWDESRAMLIITGLNDEAVSKAAQAMSSETRFPGMNGSVAFVKDTLTPSEINEANLPIVAGTFADIGYEDKILSGRATQETNYQLDIPSNWVINDEAYVDLYFSHSQIINYDDSGLTILMNNRPYTTLPLNDETALDGYIRINLVDTNIRPGRTNNLTVQVNMAVEEICIEDQSDQLWFLIKNNSNFDLAHDEISVTELLLEQYPLPFNADQTLSNLRFILPEEPVVSEWAKVLNLAANLGRSVESKTIIPHVALGDSLSAADSANSHIVAIGRPTRNSLIQQVNADLPQPFIPGSDIIEQRLDDVIFRLSPDVDLGYVQLIASPWDQKRAFLVATGTTDEGVQSAIQALIDRSNALAGNLALVRGDTINTIDTRQLTNKGASVVVATALATIAPESPITATVTPTPTPLTTSSMPETSTSSQTSNGPSLPNWLIPLVGVNGLIVIAILGFVAWRAFKKRT